MKYALVDNERREAGPKMHGLCPACNQPVIAKCGEYKINHWAHKAKVDCDKWWEPETEWHRVWKNQFNSEWQEKIMHDDKTGEKHVADVRTPDGLVVEFQHSAIKPEEQRSREAFYKKMVWVVDGKRCHTHMEYFSAHYPTQLGKSRYFRRAKDAFPRSWRESTVPVIMDFGTPPEAPDYLYCLLSKDGIMIRITRQEFIEKVKNGTWQTSIEKAPEHVKAFLDRQAAELHRQAKIRQDFFSIPKLRRMRQDFIDDADTIAMKRAELINKNQRTDTDMDIDEFRETIAELIMKKILFSANRGL